MPTPISTSPASSAGTDDVRVASAFNAHPLASATNPTTSTGRRPCLSIVRPAITAVTPDDVRKMAGPRPNSPAWPVTSTKVSVDTAAASCSTTELTALVVERSSVFRRITGARSVVICTNPRTGRRIIASERMPEKASAEITAAGRTLALSNPAKTFFPERGETKLDLASYYLAIEQPLMRALGGRPVLMERYPDGAGGSSFFQKRVPKNAPDWLQTTTVQTPNGTPSQALVAADVAHIVWAVNLGCIGLHVWPYLAADPTTPTSCGSISTPRPASIWPWSRRRSPRRGRCSMSSASRATPRPPAATVSTSTCGCGRSRTRSWCARRRWPWPVSWSAAGPT